MEEVIINLFAYDEKLLFNQIKNKLNIRSNKLTYWLTKLKREGILAKENKHYLLAESAEYLVPYLSKNNSTLPVVLIHIGNKRQALLTERTKRPYKGLLALPAGRLLIGESPQQAAKRIMHTKHNLAIKKITMKDMLLEHIQKKKQIIHSFLLIVMTAEAEEPQKFTNITSQKQKIIPSDYQIITSNVQKRALKTLISPAK